MVAIDKVVAQGRAGQLPRMEVFIKLTEMNL